MVLEFLNMAVPVNLLTLILISFGWVFFALAVVFLLVIFLWTPASKFLVARIKRKPLARVMFRDGVAEFKVGNKEVPGSMTIKKMGPVDLIEGSQLREKVSGVAMYDVFAENATSIPQTYAPIIKAIRDCGFDVVNFEQYRILVELATSEEKRIEYRQALPVDKHAEFDDKVDRLKKLKLEIKLYKTYTMHELATMFPFNMNPSYVEHYSTAQLVAFAKKMKIQKELILYAGIGVLILVIAAFIAYRFIKGDSAGANVVVQITPEIIRAAANASNVTGVVTI